MLGRPLDPESAEVLHPTTGGYPLFVIEAVRAMAEPGAPVQPAGKLNEILQRRLAQASPTAQEVAGLAASVGRYFSLDLLVEASDADGQDVVQAVDELWRRRILREARQGYDFSHDLIREAAYSAVSPPKRWLLHRRIAQALELLHGEDRDSVSAHLAEQYERGGRADRAITYYRAAARSASAVFAHLDAIRMHEKALGLIRAMPPGPNRDAQELAVLEQLAAPLNARFSYASTRLQQTLERAVELSERLGRTDSLLNGLAALWTSRFVQGRTAESYAVAVRALALVDPDARASVPGHFAVGGTAVSLGRPAEAVRHLRMATELSGEVHSLSVGTRPDVHARAWMAHAHWLLGDDAAATECSRHAVTLARRIEHPYSLTVALAYAAITRQLQDDRELLGATVDELIDLCTRYDFAYYSDWGRVLRGWVRDDIDEARRGVDSLKAAGSLARMPYWLWLVADLHARDGRTDRARATLDAALVTAEAYDDLWWAPEVMRARARLDPPAESAVRLRQAADLARRQGSVALADRCEADRARLPDCLSAPNATATPAER